MIRNFPSSFYHPHFSICHSPPSGPHFTETQQHMMVCPKHTNAYGIGRRTCEDQMLHPNISCGPYKTTSNRDRGMDQQTVLLHFPRNRPSCSSLIVVVKPIHVHLFNFLIIFIFDEDYNKDKYLNVFEAFQNNYWFSLSRNEKLKSKLLNKNSQELVIL